MQKSVTRARDVMVTNFFEIDGIATVADGLHAFKQNDIELLVIKKRDNDDAYGIVKLSDIVKKVLAKDRAVDRVNLYEIMSKPVVTIEPSMDIRYCARLFDRVGLSHALVTDAGKALGVISYRELLIPYYKDIE